MPASLAWKAAATRLQLEHQHCSYQTPCLPILFVKPPIWLTDLTEAWWEALEVSLILSVQRSALVTFSDSLISDANQSSMCTLHSIDC